MADSCRHRIRRRVRNFCARQRGIRIDFEANRDQRQYKNDDHGSHGLVCSGGMRQDQLKKPAKRGSFRFWGPAARRPLGDSRKAARERGILRVCHLPSEIRCRPSLVRTMPPKLPSRSRYPCAGIECGTECDGWSDAPRAAAGPQIPNHLALGAEFDPCRQYAPGSHDFQSVSTHYQNLPFAGLERVAGESGFCGPPWCRPIDASARLTSGVWLRWA